MARIAVLTMSDGRDRDVWDLGNVELRAACEMLDVDFEGLGDAAE